MLALRFERGRLEVREVAAPAGGEEVRVRVTAAGICNTDLEIARGYADFQGTLGHEFVGVAVEGPPATKDIIGRRVVGEINAGCGACELCRAGDARHCPDRTVLGIKGRDGSFAEELRLPLANLLLVPDEITDEQAVFTEPLAAACGVVERVPDISARTRVAVVGDGKLGLLCAQTIRALTGASVTLIGKHEDKMRIAARRGVEALALDGAARRRGEFDVAVEASGAAAGLEVALGLLRPRGVLVLKSTFHGATPLNAAPLVVDEISLVGSRCGRFAPALDLLKRRAVDVESLITETRPLADGVRAMERAAERGVLKVLLRMGDR